MASVNEIRSTFLDYFRANGHEIVASGPLVPLNDPTLMFTNAGMVQFKNVFTGMEKRARGRAATAQKCVRAGGKHNDLDNVGHTARHHTFFEMLGNFSFGDYFKDLAIELAWTLVTKEFGLPADRLLVTVFAQDDEAFDLWRRIAGLPESRIIRIPTSDNFWSMGDTGPCGPCSEIFYDHGDRVPGGPPGSADGDGDRFIEIWNLVFMQFEQRAGDERIVLPRPSIDTGMGLERISAALQGTHDNYGTDLMRALIRACADASDTDAGGAHEVSHRVIADHLRAAGFLIADGVLPSNEGRGYVLRRIMRRAMRHAELLGARDPLMWRLTPALVREMGGAYPELRRAEATIAETLKLEETRFRQTLDRGLRMLDEAAAGLGRGGTLDGEAAFRLHDTYGFPLDLTEDALRPRGIAVDTHGFDRAMRRRRAEARAAWAGSGDMAAERVWFELGGEAGATEFLGHEAESAQGVVTGIVAGGARAERAGAGSEAAVIVNQTPFYAESGGQAGDRGVMAGAGESRFLVRDTQKKPGGLFVHHGRVEAGAIAVGDRLELAVDRARRAGARANHSATHLLHEALRRTLGAHVAQKGSLVEPARLRFDFSHPGAMTREEISAVEEIANGVILQNGEVVTRLMSVDEAIGSGALALFGEKYGDEVRVVSMGRDAGAGGRETDYSVELCGGTHVRRTGDIGLVKIVGESAVAAGVRRIEALTGAGARAYLDGQDRRVRDAAAILKVRPQELTGRVRALVGERRKMEREAAGLKRRLAMSGAPGGGIRDIGPVRVMARALTGIGPKDLRGLVDDGKKTLGSGIVAIIGIGDDGKAGIAVGVTDDLTDAYDAVDLVRAGAAALGGRGGGGRPDMAQAGGPDGANADAAIDAIAERVGELAGAPRSPRRGRAR